MIGNQYAKKTQIPLQVHTEPKGTFWLMFLIALHFKNVFDQVWDTFLCMSNLKWCMLFFKPPSASL